MIERSKSLAAFMGRNITDDWLIKAIDEWYRERGRERWDAVKHKLSPSGAWSQCPREIQFKLLGYRSRVDGQAQRRMDNGTKFHERQEEVFVEMGLAVLREERLETDDVSGKPDIVISRTKLTTPLNQAEDLYLLELKSVNSSGWKQLPKPSSLATANMAALSKVRPDALLQWFEYDNLLKNGVTSRGQKLNLDIGRGFIFFENKDSQAYQIYYVIRDEKLWETLRANSRAALEWNRKGELIGPPFPKTSPICRSCDVMDICFREQEGDEKIRSIIKERLTQTKRRGTLEPA